VQEGVDDDLHVEHVHRTVKIDVGARDGTGIRLRPQEYVHA